MAASLLDMLCVVFMNAFFEVPSRTMLAFSWILLKWQTESLVQASWSMTRFADDVAGSHCSSLFFFVLCADWQFLITIRCAYHASCRIAYT